MNKSNVYGKNWFWTCVFSPGKKIEVNQLLLSRWWFQIFFMFTPIWGRFPIWLIFFRWVVQPPTSYRLVKIYPPGPKMQSWHMSRFCSHRSIPPRPRRTKPCWIDGPCQLSHEKKGPWLFRGFVGDEKLPSYIGIIEIKHEIRIPSLNNIIMESRRFFFVAEFPSEMVERVPHFKPCF